MGELVMPAGSSLTIRGKFPHARYFKLAWYRFERSTFVALGGDEIAADGIEPDAGSANPYKVGADRTVKNRSYALHVLAEDAPKNRADRPKTPMYVGKAGTRIQPVIRVYQADEGYDGAGLAPADAPSTEGPAFIYEARLADGTRLSREEVDKQWVHPLGSAPPPAPSCRRRSGRRSSSRPKWKAAGIPRRPTCSPTFRASSARSMSFAARCRPSRVPMPEPRSC